MYSWIHTHSGVELEKASIEGTRRIRELAAVLVQRIVE
jgi:hypothetical protein